jgi:predicted oxidoreductase
MRILLLHKAGTMHRNSKTNRKKIVTQAKKVAVLNQSLKRQSKPHKLIDNREGYLITVL